MWSASERSALLSQCALLLCDPLYTRAVALSLGALTVPLARVALSQSAACDLLALSLLVHAAPNTARTVWEYARRLDTLLRSLDAAVARAVPSSLAESLASIYRLVLCSSLSATASQRVAVSEWRALGDWRALFALTTHADPAVSAWARELSALVLGASEAQRDMIRTPASEIALAEYLSLLPSSLFELIKEPFLIVFSPLISSFIVSDG